MYKNIIKPIFDKLFALVLLVLLSPFLLLIMILLFFSQGQVFFVQTRPGKHEKLFQLFKFKTLEENTGNEEIPISWFCNFLRKSSLDELPQLINILKGEMSFVGPRPLLVEYLPLYSEEHLKRHLVLPGLTGLAQVNGRNLTSWKERLDLDIVYSQSVSFNSDLKIVLITLKQLFWKTNGGSSVTMPRFEGYQ